MNKKSIFRILCTVFLLVIFSALLVSCADIKGGDGDVTNSTDNPTATEVGTPTPEPTLAVIEITPIPTDKVNSSMKPQPISSPSPTSQSTATNNGSVTVAPSATANATEDTTAAATEDTTANATAEVTGDATDAPVTTAPTDVPTAEPTKVPDKYDGFYDVMANTARRYVKEEVSESGTVVCYPVNLDAKYEVVPYVEFVTTEENGETVCMLEFFGTTYIFKNRPERIMLYWSSNQLHNDGYYHITNLYILVDDSYLVYGENITSASLPGRGNEFVS